MSEGRRSRRRSRPSRPPSKPRPILGAGLVGLGVLLAAAVTAHALLQTGVIRETAAAQVSEGWSVLARPRDRRDLAEAERLAKTSLERQPLQAGASSLLAVIAEERGDQAATERLMRAASQLSRRDNIADYWLFDHELSTGAADRAALHADALLRRDFTTVQNYVYPRMLAGFSNPAFVRAVAERLAKHPEWRPYFLQFAATKLKDPTAAFVIFSAMQSAGSPPTSAELEPYYRRLLGEGRFEEAYLAWVLFLPQQTVSHLTNIYDGRFEGWPETPPFGWVFERGARGSIEPSDAYGRQGMALRVDYDSLSMPKMPTQVLILPPGRYRLSGLVLTPTAEAAGSMTWAINCGDVNLLAKYPVPDTKSAWMSFSQEFVVPGDCKGQTLTLIPIPSGERENIEVWFDNLAIDRVESAS